ncbi:type II toxin-antitoxin system RelE/ParE family toxin [Nitrospirillum viridazoti]|uniref:Plasmid stabilization system protein ParE n=1 Tax=Nitrospirillum amazonense TaxID=28077 RepID=A0A560IK66_9PROT|nr:type II toxin-antitoxin system RelE/ParE family toxin [Nitrospirillum amazonense]TWB59432.1 plasmid stabilization system protein ParE [Nitrospirillum amazonense]
MTYRVIFSPQALEQLAKLYHYIAEAASPGIAAHYTEAIVGYCEQLCAHPYRGTMRDDVRPGLRITNYRKRTVVAFDIDGDVVSIIGIFYGGQNYEAILRDESDDSRSSN